MNCSCGKPANAVIDYTLDKQRVRIIVCEECRTETLRYLTGQKIDFDIVLRPEDIHVLDAKPCWCGSRRHGLILASGCPEHGMVEG